MFHFPSKFCLISSILIGINFLFLFTSSIPLAKKNNEKEAKRCGQIELALYGINTLRPGGVPIDRLFLLNHLGVRVCDIEFHFGYEFLISICQSPDVGASEIVCTNELNPEFETYNEGRQVRIKEKFYLKFGRIAKNLKTRTSKNLSRRKLFDSDENPLETRFTLKEIITKVLNGHLRKGQLDFPKVRLSKKNGNKFKILLGGKKAMEMELPNGIKTIEEWNQKVDAHSLTQKFKKKGKLFNEANILKGEEEKFYSKLIEIENKFKGKKIERFGTNGKNAENSSALAKLNAKQVNEDSVEENVDENDELSGRFSHGTYHYFLNNCVDFATNFIGQLSEKEVQRPWVMGQMLAIRGFRLFYYAWKRGIKLMAEASKWKVDFRKILDEFDKLTPSKAEKDENEDIFYSAESKSFEKEEENEFKELDLREYEKGAECLEISQQHGEGGIGFKKSIKTLLSIGVIMYFYSQLFTSCPTTSHDGLHHNIAIATGQLFSGNSLAGGGLIPAGHANHYSWH